MSLPGRHCAICGRMGGSGSENALRAVEALAAEQGVTLRWSHEPRDDRKAHGPCVIREKKRLAKLTPGK